MMLLLFADFEIAAPTPGLVDTVWTTHICAGGRSTWADWAPYKWNEIV